MENWEVAAALERMAGLLALKGEQDFKVRAYSHAARQILRTPEHLVCLIEDGRLTGLPGIGKALAAKIEELATTGHSAFLVRLEAEVPAELLALFSIGGVGFKTAAALVQGLGLQTMAQLKEAALEGRVGRLPGLGKSLENSILQYFEQRHLLPEGFHRGVAVPLAEQLERFLRGLSNIIHAQTAGEIRRGTELVAEVLVVAAQRRWARQEELKEALWGLPGLTKVEPVAAGFNLTGITGLPIRLILVEEAAYPAALAYFTGSKRHWERLAELARHQGMRLEAQGLFNGKGSIPLEEEADLYRILGLSYIPPELREDAGEVEAATRGRLPELVEPGDIRGDLHLHTRWSDGTGSVKEMVGAGAARGYEYIAVTDHSPSLKIAGGLSAERLLEQVREIRDFNETGGRCRVLAGVEMDIRSDGSPDLPDELLSELDLVIASVHSNFRQSRAEMTERICRAMEHPLVQIIGHPTGRLLGSRGGYQVDLESLIRKAAATETILEINASPQRLDLPEAYLKDARLAGVRLVVNTDAHSTVTMQDMPYGVTVARRGGLEAGDLLNTLPLEELLKALRRKKRRWKV